TSHRRHLYSHDVARLEELPPSLRCIRRTGQFDHPFFDHLVNRSATEFPIDDGGGVRYRHDTPWMETRHAKPGAIWLQNQLGRGSEFWKAQGRRGHGAQPRSTSPAMLREHMLKLEELRPGCNSYRDAPSGKTVRIEPGTPRTPMLISSCLPLYV